MRTLLAILLVAPLVAGAQEPPQQQVDDRPYWERCQRIMRMQPYVPYRIDVPLRIAGEVGSAAGPSSGGGKSGGGGGSGGGSFSGGGGGGGGGGNLGYAVLVLAVVVVAALPF